MALNRVCNYIYIWYDTVFTDRVHFEKKFCNIHEIYKIYNDQVF